MVQFRTGDVPASLADPDRGLLLCTIVEKPSGEMLGGEIDDVRHGGALPTRWTFGVSIIAVSDPKLIFRSGRRCQ